MPNNEGKACDAVIRVVEARTGAVRADITHPEDDGIGPPVELRLNMRSQNAVPFAVLSPGRSICSHL